MPLTVDVPDDSRPGKVRPGGWSVYSRNFNRPTGLDESSRVRVRIASWSGSLRAIFFNSESIPIGDPPLQFDITSELQSHNQLRIRIDDDQQSAGRLDGAVELMIE